MIPYLWTECSNAIFIVEPFILTRSNVAPNGKTVRTSSIVIEPVSWTQRGIKPLRTVRGGWGGFVGEKCWLECYHFCSVRLLASVWHRCWACTRPRDSTGAHWRTWHCDGSAGATVTNMLSGRCSPIRARNVLLPYVWNFLFITEQQLICPVLPHPPPIPRKTLQVWHVRNSAQHLKLTVCIRSCLRTPSLNKSISCAVFS